MAVDVVLKDRNGNELNVGGKLYKHNINFTIDEDGMQVVYLTHYSTSASLIETMEQLCTLFYENEQINIVYVDDNEGETYTGILRFYTPNDFTVHATRVTNYSTNAETYVSFQNFTNVYNIYDTIIPL